MAFDPSTIPHTPSRWLRTRIRHEGVARAEFTDPPGAVEGAATVRVDATGACRVRLSLDRIDAPESFTLSSGTVSAADYRRRGFTNPCSSLTVRTADGVFTSSERVLHDGAPFGANALNLTPLRARFVVADAPAAFWVLPLSNFIQEVWPPGFPELANHPLRVFPTPAVPAGLPEDELLAATLHAARHDRLLTFLVVDRPGFIERLPKYGRRLRRLRRRGGNLLTAVAVGPAHVQSVDFADFAGLFPLDVVGFLTLATGLPVGAPWVEFRDGRGCLVSREYVRFGAEGLRRGHAAVRDVRQNAVGYLIGRVFASPERGRPYLRAAVNHAVKAADVGSLEDRFIHLCRAFETLCRHHGIARQDLAADLDPAQAAAVRAALDVAAGQVQGLARRERDHGRKNALNRIAARARSAADIDNDFGQAVVALVDRWGLPDACIIQAHLDARPHPAAETWARLLYSYRGAATHEGYFDIFGRHDHYDILRVMDHLHDVLLRILFKTIGYDGPYQPPIPPLAMRPCVDWVTPATPAAALGFH